MNECAFVLCRLLSREANSGPVVILPLAPTVHTHRKTAHSSDACVTGGSSPKHTQTYIHTHTHSFIHTNSLFTNTHNTTTLSLHTSDNILLERMSRQDCRQKAHTGTLNICPPCTRLQITYAPMYTRKLTQTHAASEQSCAKLVISRCKRKDRLLSERLCTKKRELEALICFKEMF